jgi:hypothetical protein
MTTTLLLLLLLSAARHAGGPRVGTGTMTWWGMALAAMCETYGTGLTMALAWPVAWRLLGDRLSFARAARRIGTALPWVLLAACTLHHLYGVRLLRRAGDSVPWSAVGPGAVAMGLLAGAAALPVLGAYGLAALALGFFGTHVAYPVQLVALGLAGLGGLAWSSLRAADGETRRWCAVVALLWVASYAAIAVGRGEQLLTHTGSWVQIGAVERYHYSGTALACIGLALLLRSSPAATVLSPTARRVAVLALLGVVTAGAVRNRARIDLHEPQRREVASILAQVRTAVAATPPGGVTRIPLVPFATGTWLMWFPGSAGVFAIAFPTNTLDGRRVVFESINQTLLERAHRGRRLRSLILPKGAPVPAG